MSETFSDASTLSLSRAIAFASLLIAMSWLCVRFVSSEKVRQLRDVATARAVAAYNLKRYDHCAEKYEDIIAYSNEPASRIVALREQATCYGLEGKYGKQLKNHLEARRLASRHALDSLQAEAEQSIGNIYAACQRNEKFCTGVTVPTENTWISSWAVPSPVLLFLISLAAIGLIYVASSDPE